MTQKLLLIDFENVQQFDLSSLEHDNSINIMIFVGAGQKAIPIDLASSVQKFGTRLKYQPVEGNGPNSLDYHIACHLGRVLEKSPQFQCFVLSKDTGFDPLLRYLNKLGLKCRRINSLHELDPQTAPVAGARNTTAAVVPGKPAKKTSPQAAPGNESNYKRVVEILGREKNARPRKLKTLAQHITSICQNQIAQKDVERIIIKLKADKMISETANAITYNF